MTIPDEDKVLQDLLNTILIVAMDDGSISDDELAILKQVKLDVKTLRMKIEDLENQPHAKENELKLLQNFKKDILQNAYSISQSNKKISQEEKNLINCLISLLMT